jgi:hypothetical protein
MRKPDFKINSCTASGEGDSKQLVIEGQKLPPPSKRITLRQKNIKIIDAKIIYKHKKGDIECEIKRINRVKSFGEIRLHTNSVLYPGIYIVSLSYAGELDEKMLLS